MKRRVMSVGELASLVQWKKPSLNLVQSRLDKALTVWDLRRLAQRRTPKAAFDYTDGAAEDEISIRRARQAFRDIEFHPAILRNVSQVCLEREVLGQVSDLPFGIAPTGFTRLMHTQGETAGVQAAWRAGIPFSLSTLATTSLEEVARVAPGARRWFQLYMWKDRQRSMALLERAWHAGYDTVLVTVDCPVSGARLRDTRNGLAIPPALTLETIVNTIPKVSWWFNFLTTEPLTFASLSHWPGTVSDYIDSMFDPSLTFEDLAWIQRQWPGKFVVKGIQTLADARRLAQMGVDAIVLSNHGGRQLDRAPVPFHLLPQVAREIGQEVEIIVDTGIMSGADIIACLALGARFTLIGRAYLYGLMAGGQAGVNRVITILTTQMRRTMQLLGVSSLEELTPDHVSQYPLGAYHLDDGRW